MSYYKTGMSKVKEVTKGSSGAATAASMPNHGTSILTGTSGGSIWVLQPPEAGVRKRIIINGVAATDLQVIKASTTGSDAITFVGATTGINTLTLTTVHIGRPVTIDLEGLNSTSWIITGIYPETSVGTATYSSA